ncbi:MAG: ABC transporter permease [Bacteroidota bacterium]|nr:ABC transporter permease [Bacteroidota bacterium]MDX5427415.1 ABC transporter permease [Bacteroidota bacterium]MDX5447465.1 ABC transporter permease [Bacteroidota bacterium]MDX5505360.1 ABC transporter permease [Bacteroidota bacterium]
MIRLILNKISYALIVLWGVSSLVFFLFTLLPGDPAKMMMDKREDPDLLAAIRAKYGLDRSVGEQYLLFLNDLSPISWHGNDPGDFTFFTPEKYSGVHLFQAGNGALHFKWPYLRESFQMQGRSVSGLIGDTLPNTMVLAISAIIFALVIGLFIGILSALWKDSFFDRFWTVFGTIGMSVPSFFSAILMAWIFGFLLADLTGLNMTGNLWELDDLGEGMHLRLQNLILPALTLGIRPLGVIIQLSRSSMLETLSQDYIRTARAKGLSTPSIIRRHALRNSLNPVITAVSGWLASMLAGAVFVEYIFGWNGLGKQIVEALNQMDIPVVMGAVLTIAFIFVIINILVDLIYAWLDPRVRVR